MPPEMGISHDVFKEGEDGGEDGEGAEEEPAEGEEAAEGDKSDILTSYKHKFVKEVVREKRMHYWQVPRLGSFMAVPLVYKSCISEEAIDKAIENWQEVLK